MLVNIIILLSVSVVFIMLFTVLLYIHSKRPSRRDELTAQIQSLHPNMTWKQAQEEADYWLHITGIEIGDKA
jgi:hypothetical protein